jgi:putative SOS response-associated peptidase YedK
MEHWAGRDGSEVDTALILTTNANALVAPIHDRMPVIVPPEHFGRWLDCKNVSEFEVSDVLLPPPADLLEAIPVSDRVNRVVNDGPDLQQPQAVGAPQPTVRPGAVKVAPAARKPVAKAAGQGDLF